MKERLKRFMMSFTYEERRKKQYEEYKRKKNLLKAMSKEERMFQYTMLNTGYEYQKNIFLILLMASVLIFLNTGIGFWNLVKHICTYAGTLGAEGIEFAEAAIAASIIVTAFILFLVFMIINQKVKELRAIKNDMEIIFVVAKEVGNEDSVREEKIIFDKEK